MLKRLIDLMRKPPRPDSLRPISPRVTPDAEAAAELERRRASVTYLPEFRDSILARRFGK